MNLAIPYRISSATKALSPRVTAIVARGCLTPVTSFGWRNETTSPGQSCVIGFLKRAFRWSRGPDGCDRHRDLKRR
jgi:hypothetical protein